MSSKNDTSCEPSVKKKRGFGFFLKTAFSVARGLFLIYRIWLKVKDFLTDL